MPMKQVKFRCQSCKKTQCDLIIGTEEDDIEEPIMCIYERMCVFPSWRLVSKQER